MLQSWQSFQLCCWSVLWHQSLGGDDRNKHDINPSMGRSCNHTPSSKGFTIHDARTPVCINGPSSEIIASFTC